MSAVTMEGSLTSSSSSALLAPATTESESTTANIFRELEQVWGNNNQKGGLYFDNVHYVGTIFLITILQLIWFVQYKRGITRKSISISHKCLSRYHQYYKVPVALLSHAASSSHDHHYHLFRQRTSSGDGSSSSAEDNAGGSDADIESRGLLNNNNDGASTSRTTTTTRTPPTQTNDRWRSSFVVVRTWLESFLFKICRGSLSGLPLLTLNTHLLWKVRTLELLLGGPWKYLQCLSFLGAFTMVVQYGIKYFYLKWLLQPVRVVGGESFFGFSRTNIHEQHERAVQTVNQNRQQYDKVLHMSSSSFTPIVVALMHIHSHIAWTIQMANSWDPMTGEYTPQTIPVVKLRNYELLYMCALYMLSGRYYENSILHGGWFCGFVASTILEIPLVWNRLPFQTNITMSSSNTAQQHFLRTSTWFMLLFLIITSAKAAGGEGSGEEEGHQQSSNTGSVGGGSAASAADRSTSSSTTQQTLPLPSPSLTRWTKLFIPCLEYVGWDHRGILNDIRTYRSYDRQGRSSSNNIDEEEYEDENAFQNDEEMVPLNNRQRTGEGGGDIENPIPRSSHVFSPLTARQSSNTRDGNSRTDDIFDEFGEEEEEEEGSFVGS